ncbi:MAG: hypothetical protein TH68_03735, partial [Candidatus Synechococcus spongiarum 142]
MPIIPQSVANTDNVNVNLPVCYALVLAPRAVATVEGGTSTYTVQLSAQPSSDVTVTVGGMGSGITVDTDSVMQGDQATLGFTTTNWNTAQTVTVAVAENASAEAVTLTHTTTSMGYTYSVSQSLRVTAIDNGAPGLVLPVAVTVAEAGSAIYMVRLAKEPAAAVTVTVHGMGSGVSVDTDGGMEGEQASLSFTTSNWQTEQPVTVSAAADADARSEEVTLTHTATGGDYGSVTAPLVVTVTEDETASLVFSPAAMTVAEAGSAIYMVQLATLPTEPVTVTVSGMGSGVSVDTDGGMQGTQTTLSFTTSNWNTGQPVIVSATADENATSEEVTLTHTAAGGEYAMVSQELAVTVADNETPGLVFSPTELTVAETGRAAYKVKLASQPTAAVTVTVSGMGGSNVSVDTDSSMDEEQTTLSFTTGNWNREQTVRVRGLDDANISSEMVTLTHSAGGGDYGSVSQEFVVTVTDDDNICENLSALNDAGTSCDLSRQGIEPLSSDSFNGLSKLRTLILDRNELSSLPEDVFADLSNLRTLRMSNNNLSSLPEDVFDGLSNLRTLRMSNNNLSSLPEDVFDGLSNLQTLILGSNELSNLPEDVFAGLSNLQTLILDENNLSSLPADVFDGLSNLQILHLWTNELSSLPEDIFADLPNLQTLSLSGNNLTCLPNIPPTVTTIDVNLPGCYTLVLSPSEVGVVEAGSTTYTVKLASQPMEAVTVTVHGMDNGVSVDTDGGMGGQQTSLSFTTSNWETEQTVTVRAADDANASPET